MSSRAFGGHLIFAFLVALFLRLYGVDEAALTQWDEGPYAGAAMDKGPSVREDPRIVYAPPLFPDLCGALYSVFGEDPRLAIGLAGVLGALTVFAAALLARILFGSLAGVFAAWILALEPISVAHSRLALTESTFTLLTLIGIYFAIRTLRSGNTMDAVRLGLLAGVTTLTKFHGFLPLAVFIVICLGDAFFSTDRAARLRKHFRSAVIAGLVALPFAVLVLREITAVMTLAEFSQSREQWVMGLHGYTILATTRYAIDAVRELGAVGLAILGVLGSALSLPLLFGRSRRPELWIVFGYAAILGLTLITYRDYVRLLVPAIALLAVFGGYPLSALSGQARSASTTEPDEPERPNGGRMKLAWVALAICAATGIPALKDALSFRGDGYRQMATQIEEVLRDEPGKMIAVAQQSLFPYLSKEACDEVWWITEPTGQAMTRDASFRYLITDQDYERHDQVSPHVDGFKHRLELIAEVENPLPRAVLFDRLRPEALRRFDRDPESPEFEDATRLRLFRLRDP